MYLIAISLVRWLVGQVVCFGLPYNTTKEAQCKEEFESSLFVLVPKGITAAHFVAFKMTAAILAVSSSLPAAWCA